MILPGRIDITPPAKAKARKDSFQFSNPVRRIIGHFMQARVVTSFRPTVVFDKHDVVPEPLQAGEIVDLRHHLAGQRIAHQIAGVDADGAIHI